MREADLIALIDAGRESGSYETLLARDGAHGRRLQVLDDPLAARGAGLLP